MVHAFPHAEDVVIDVCDGGGDRGDTHAIYRSRQHRIEQLPNRPIHDAFSSRFYDVVSPFSSSSSGKHLTVASCARAS